MGIRVLFMVLALLCIAGLFGIFPPTAGPGRDWFAYAFYGSLAALCLWFAFHRVHQD